MLTTFAFSLYEQGRHREALSFYLHIFEKSLPPDHPLLKTQDRQSTFKPTSTFSTQKPSDLLQVIDNVQLIAMMTTMLIYGQEP